MNGLPLPCRLTRVRLRVFAGSCRISLRRYFPVVMPMSKRGIESSWEASPMRFRPDADQAPEPRLTEAKRPTTSQA